jgi:hypothetical protein
MFAHRDQFSHLELMRRFHLGTPVGINGFYSAWDETCDAVHEERGYVPHPDNFSPLQAARAASDRAERARQVLFKDFVLSDLFPADEVDPSVPLPLGTIALEIVYEDEHMCEDGELMLPARTAHEPEVSYTPHPISVDARGAPECGMYTLMLVDPDAPSRIHHEMRENVKWAVMNIPQERVTEGEYVLTYQTPAPAYASGLHRYIFCLYKQKRPFTPAELHTAREHFSKRSGIHTYEWVRSQQDALHNIPVGVEAFLSEWDASVDEMHRALGYMPPPQHRSPAQKRAMLAAEASKPSATPVFTPAGGDADHIMERLKKIQEAHQAFNSTVTGNTTMLTNLDAEAKAKARAIEDAPSGPVYMIEPEADAKTAVVPASKPKVAPRAPITLSGNSKVISSAGASASLDISIQQDESSSAAAAAALLNSSAGDAVMQQETTRQESSKSAVASSQRATHKSEQNNTATVSTTHQQHRSDGQYSEERTEQVTEEKREDTTEDLTEGLTESFNQSQVAQRTAFDAASTQATNSAASMLAQEQQAQEAARQQQQQQVQQRQQELLERQRQEMELQENARQAQQAKLLKQQQEALERQKAQEQERIRQAELGSAPQQPHHRGARKQKSREFFSAIPDSEYSDTDASAFDNGSVFSASPAPSRYSYLQTQNSNSSYGGPISDGIGTGRPQIVPEGDDSRSEYSDTSGASSLARLNRSSDENASGAKRSPKAVDVTMRLKQIQEGVLQAKSSNQLCDLFGVSTPSIFTGGRLCFTAGCAVCRPHALHTD